MNAHAIRTRSLARVDLPVQFARLRDIAYNLWWSWTPSAQELFERIDPVHWRHYRSPIEVLIDLEPEQWHQLQGDPGFVRMYRRLVDRFDEYMVPTRPTWYDQNFPDNGGPIAYFSTEFGWHESLQVYSGGLGILSGDHSKSASDLGLPFIGIGLMYRRGYFRQTVDSDGQQQHFYPNYDVSRLPLLPVLDGSGDELQVQVPLPGRDVTVRVWKANVGRVPVLLLDSDLPDNRPADRSITSILYVSGREMRLCQEILLGVGGCMVLEALGIAPRVWHMNEGHSALLAVHRAIGRMRGGMPLDQALQEIASNSVFTTHTPVPAGNESFERELVRRYFERWTSEDNLDIDGLLALGDTGNNGHFNMTALALRSAERTNGVSELHGKVADGMWRNLTQPAGRSVGHITNGVHLPSWVGPEIYETLRRNLGRGFAQNLFDPGFHDAVMAIPDEEIWDAHQMQKRQLIELARELALAQFARHGRSPGELDQVDERLDPDALLIGFARRFATYKRADLLLRDMDRMREIVCRDDRPVQFLFAGKAHPADRPGQDLIRRIFHASNDPALCGRLLFLENYDIRIGRGMVQGVDVWLNNPRRPLEASGTSGMKAAMNGGLNCSVLDGWWCEGYDAEHGWAIGAQERPADDETEDREDAEELYRLLQDEIATCYYDRNAAGLPEAWIARMKKAIASLSPRFSTARMVQEYTEQLYRPAADGVTARTP